MGIFVTANLIVNPILVFTVYKEISKYIEQGLEFDHSSDPFIL